MIIRVSGFLGFFLMPRARLKNQANTERNGLVGSRSATGRQKPEEAGNPDDLEGGGRR